MTVAITVFGPSPVLRLTLTFRDEPVMFMVTDGDTPPVIDKVAGLDSVHEMPIVTARSVVLQLGEEPIITPAPPVFETELMLTLLGALPSTVYCWLHVPERPKSLPPASTLIADTENDALPELEPDERVHVLLPLLGTMLDKTLVPSFVADVSLTGLSKVATICGPTVVV